MSMFNTPQTNSLNPVRQDMFAVGGMPNQMGGMPNQMGGGIMGGQPQWSSNMMSQSQMVQQHQNMSTMNPSMMMQGHVGMNQPQMMGMQPCNMGMQNGYGMPNGVSVKHQNTGQQQQQRGGPKIDQFAEFGSF